MSEKRQKRNDGFSKRLFGLWQPLGIPQKEFAKYLGISENAAGNYLKKGRVPQWNILVRVADYFKKSIDWLLTGQEKRPADYGEAAGSTSGPGSIGEDGRKWEVPEWPFKDKKLGNGLMKDLVFVEAEDPEKYRELVERISGAAFYLRYKKNAGNT